MKNQTDQENKNQTNNSKEQVFQTTVAQEAPQEFKDDNLTVQLSLKRGCLGNLFVTVKPLAVQAAYQKALKNVKKDISVPGFRKGKVPEDMILKNFSDKIDREWKELVLQTAFRESLNLINMTPFSKNAVKRTQLKKCSQEEGAEATFEIEFHPKISKIDVATLNTMVLPARIADDKDVTNEIRALQLRETQWEEITDRPVQVDDYVVIDVDVVESPAHNIISGYLCQVNKEELPSWIYDLVIGMNLLESREGTAISKDDSGLGRAIETVEPGNKLLRITIKNIRTGTLPELDDELAKKFKYPSFSELKADVKNKIQAHEDEKVRQVARDELFTEILMKYPIDLPRSFIEAEVNNRINLLKGAVDQKEGALPWDSLKEPQLKVELYGSFLAYYSMLLLLDDYMKKYEIRVSQMEVVREMLLDEWRPVSDRLTFVQQGYDERSRRVYTHVAMRKTLDKILDLIQAK